MDETIEFDDDLARFAREGAPALPRHPKATGMLAHDGARIWYASWGQGAPVILLHGGLGHSGNFGFQVPALLSAGYEVIVIDSRGHGRSSLEDGAFHYQQMSMDVRAVMDLLGIARAALVGWSDGAVVALTLAMHAPQRVAKVLFFACNVDPGGTKEIASFGGAMKNCFQRHEKDYQALSATPAAFGAFVEGVTMMMQSEPNYSAYALGAIAVPVTVAISAQDEFIKLEHARYIARCIPGATFVELVGVSHFAPLQRPQVFNNLLLSFLEEGPVQTEG